MLQSKNLQIKYESQKAYSNLLKHLKDVAFNEKWASIFGYAWTEVINSRGYIQKLGGPANQTPISPRNKRFPTEMIDLEDIRVQVPSLKP